MSDRLFGTALHALTVQVEGALFVVDLRDGGCFELNGAAAVIWRGLVGGRPPAEISRELAARFGIDEPRAQADVAAFVSGLAARGLVREDLPGAP